MGTQLESAENSVKSPPKDKEIPNDSEKNKGKTVASERSVSLRATPRRASAQRNKDNAQVQGEIHNVCNSKQEAPDEQPVEVKQKKVVNEDDEKKKRKALEARVEAQRRQRNEEKMRRKVTGVSSSSGSSSSGSSGSSSSSSSSLNSSSSGSGPKPTEKEDEDPNVTVIRN